MAKKQDGRANNGRNRGAKNKVQGEIIKAGKKTGSVKKDDSDYSALTKDEFMKVQPGETQSQWEQRTRKRRVISLDNKITQKSKEIEFLPDGKIIFKRRKIVGLARQTKTVLQSEYKERTYDFMKHYSLVMRWASLNFGVLKDDIEIGYYFYDHKPFTIEEFNHFCIQLGTVRGVFSRFYKNGYICSLEIGLGDFRNSRDTKIYTLSRGFQIMIERVYRVIAKLTPITVQWSKGLKLMDSDMTQELLEMYEQADEILKGLRKPEKIRFRNEENE